MGLNAPGVPALALVIFHDEHVVGEVPGKAQLAFVSGTGLGILGSGYRNLVSHFHFPLS
jgi:hypothetical protein